MRPKNAHASAAPLAIVLSSLMAVQLVPSPTVAQQYVPQGQYSSQPSNNVYAQCMNAASRQSGYTGATTGENGQVLAGAAAGAFMGSWVGGWNGNAGEGAGWGAAAGAVVGASRRRREKKNQENAKNAYDQAFQQCMQYNTRPPVTPVPAPASQPDAPAYPSPPLMLSPSPNAPGTPQPQAST